MATYGFSEGDAKRIGRAVRLVERGPEQVRLGGAENERGAAPVRIMIGKATTAAWTKGTTATVTIYSGAPGVEVTAATVVAHNYFATIGTADTTARWVGLSHNGYGWLLIAAECD